MDLQSLGTEFTGIENILLNSKMYADAKKELIDSIVNTSMSKEKQTSLIQQFASQVALGFPSLIFDKIIQLRNLESEIALRSAQIATEGKKQANLQADSDLKNAQKSLINAEVTTETKKQANLQADSDLKVCQKDLTCISKYEKMGSASKQLGILVTHSSWSDQGNGLIDKQIKGFSGDMHYKILKTLSEQAGMLAQNDVATPSWMTTDMQTSISYMKTI